MRADLKELMDMDLDGAPYAYTPFCNDRPEVEGFRYKSAFTCSKLTIEILYCFYC